MYIIEGPGNGFNNIGESIYWAIITLTTVGYGNIVPATVFGKILASFIMILGYAVIAVPTGISCNGIQFPIFISYLCFIYSYGFLGCGDDVRLI